MAAKAREILEWCRYGLQKMESDPTGFDWVMIWAGTIALLRAIGHALDKEDAKSDHRLKKAQSAWWRGLKDTKPDPLIFWEFIERDRNQLLKEADLTVGQGIHVEMHDIVHSSDVFSAHLSGQEPAPPEQQSPPPRSTNPSPPPTTATFSYRMNSGRFAGQDPRDLVRDAIEWWGKELDEIEQKATTISS
jgi:hypothetical protein